MGTIKYLYTILLALTCGLLGYSQVGPLRDNTNTFVKSNNELIKANTSSTELKWSAFPPDTIIDFLFTTTNPGDVSTPGLASGVESYWSFEETSGITSYDSAASYDGTLTNSPAQSQTGKSNLCYSYTATSSQWIDYTTSYYDVGTNDLTVSAWIKLNTIGGQYGIVGNWGIKPYWYIRVNSSQVYGIVNFGVDNIETIQNANPPLTTGVWYHIIYQLDRDGNTKLFINNSLQTDVDDISAYSATSLANANTMAVGRIGNDAGGYYMNGYIDEVSVYNRLTSGDENSQLYDLGAGKFWPYGVIGGDSLTMTNNGFDPRGDSVRTLWKYTGWPTTKTDGTLQFAFNMTDSADYKDTTYAWDGRGDTLVYYAAFTGLDDIWTEVPNRYAVFIDSSDVKPEPQDPSDWIIYYTQDFEQHVTAPLEYTTAVWWTDDWGANRTSRSADPRWPGWWEGQVPDSIVVDDETNSKVFKFSFEDTIADGFGGQLPYRGGDMWISDLGDLTGIGEHQELYVSFNIKFRPGFDWHWVGKIINVNGGAPLSAQTLNYNTRPGYGEGFNFGMIWIGDETIKAYLNPNYSAPAGGLSDYFFYQNMSPLQYGEQDWWDTYQPAGLDYDNEFGFFYFITTPERWYNITYRIVMNTWTEGSVNSDGIYEGFVNGKLVHGHYNMMAVDDSQEGLGINTISFNTFFGGGANYHKPQRDEWELIDDLHLWIYDPSADVPRGNERSPQGRVLNLPGEKKYE